MDRATILAAAYPDVTPVPGEPTAYYVRSAVSPKRGPYLVRLESYLWNGACPCISFGVNFRPKLEAGALPSESLRCPHIKRARSYHLDIVGPAMDRLHFHQPIECADVLRPAVARLEQPPAPATPGRRVYQLHR